MRLILVLLLSFSLNGCTRSYEERVVEIGMRWIDIQKMTTKNGWTDVLAKFELEKDFSDKGGRMYVFKHPGGSIVYFSTLPVDGVETLVCMNPPDGDAMSYGLNILKISVE